MHMFTSYVHIKKPKLYHRFFDDFRPGTVPLNFQSSRRITSINISTDIRYCKVAEIKLIKS